MTGAVFPPAGGWRLGLLAEGLARLRARAGGRAGVEELRRRLSTLTLRERQVLAGVSAGHANKVVGFDLGIAEKTVKIHRAKVMRKLRAGSFAELVRIADRLGVSQGA